MKKNLLILIVVILVSFFAGSYYKDINIYEAAKNYPKTSLDLPAQWFMMESTIGWEKMMFIFGYANNIEACEHLAEVAKEEAPSRNFKCVDVN